MFRGRVWRQQGYSRIPQYNIKFDIIGHGGFEDLKKLTYVPPILAQLLLCAELRPEDCFCRLCIAAVDLDEIRRRPW